MSNVEKYHPSEANIGEHCLYWKLGGIATNCCYPKLELNGRSTCNGVIDDVCLYMKDGRVPGDFSQLLLMGIKTGPHDSSLLPPGEII